MATGKSSQTEYGGNIRKASRRGSLVSATLGLSDIIAGKTIQTVLASLSDRPDRALISDTCFGTVRHYFSLRENLSSLLKQPPDKLDTKVWHLLLVSAYQLRFTRVKPYALVSEAVNAVRILGHQSASGLVNAVLRKFEPSREATSIEATYEAPQWLIDSLIRDYPNDWQDILKTSLTRAPLTLRINKSVISPQEYQSLLHQDELSFTQGCVPETISLAKPIPQSDIPGIKQGYVSIQDAHSQMAARLMDLQKGLRVLDVCAAPGNKTIHMLDICSSIELNSIDKNASRSHWFFQQPKNLTRGHRISVGDGTNLAWWDGQNYDRILLDAPCSGTGTLRRNPDIKINRQSEDVDGAQKSQLRLLRNVWQTLKPGGLLLYSTCSLLRSENEDVIHKFTENQADVSINPLDISQGIKSSWGVQLLPEVDGGDGFFYSVLKRNLQSR